MKIERDYTTPLMVHALHISEKITESDRYKEEVVDKLVKSHPLIERAWQTAIFYHRGIDQIRRHKNDLYENHLLEACVIASIIANRFQDFFNNKVSEDMTYLQILMVALLLHDVVEDTPCTISNLENKFPAEIVFLVKGLTDADFRLRLNWKQLPLSRNRNVRLLCKIHKLDASLVPPEGIGRRDTHTLLHFAKLCDVISNTSTIVKYDQGFAALYLAEKCLILSKLFHFLVQHHASDFYDNVYKNLLSEVWQWLADLNGSHTQEELITKSFSMNEYSRHSVTDLKRFDDFTKALEDLAQSFSEGLKQIYTDEIRRQKICGF